MTADLALLLPVGRVSHEFFVLGVVGFSLFGLGFSASYCFEKDSRIEGTARILWFLGALVWIGLGAFASLATGWWIAIANLAPIWVLKEVARRPLF